MSTWIKICGLSTPETVDAAVAAGADAVGFVFAAGSPRTVDVETASALRERVPEGVEAVGVFRGQPMSEVVATARAAGLTSVQLHGDESPADVAEAHAAGLRVVRAVSAQAWAAEDEEARAAYREDVLLLDAVDPGAGQVLDPALLSATAPAGPWVLAGGLSPDNVAASVRLLRPTGVDVSSGVESSRGVKSPDAITRFVDAVRSAD
jgi:phosphoribosylanthranilate isomerase